MQIVATRWSKRDSRARLLRWLRVGGHPRWPGRAGGVGGGKRPARGQRHGEQESSSASLTAGLRVMVSAAPPLPGHCGERSNVCEECVRRGKPAESSCSPQNSAVAAACIRLEASQMACCISGLVPVLAVDVSISSSQSVRGWRVAGGGGVAAMSKPCARILTPTCGAYVAHVVWVLCFFCLSVLSLPPLASRSSRVFCQQRWCRFVFRSASPPLC